ncbi:AAA family ATPase [Mesorhizobium sp.]|uniref:ATP-dependent nuclease n=1 Tax=Mesorhizobium sp. TaxID=1871066 RepID=UPI00257B7B3B|nr:AAA family ATPase [Mesorhizobium sp.]
MLRQLRVANFRRFDNFTVSFKEGNILAGPNNCGKSSLIDAIRIIASCIRTMKKTTPTLLQLDDGRVVDGHIVPEHRIGINLANSIHNYNDDDAIIEVTLHDNSKGTVLLSRERPTRFFVEQDGKRLNSASKFNAAFPLNCAIVPTLGPLEQDEQWVEDETIQKRESARTSSRHLRNVWYRKSEIQFSAFATDVAQAWKGIEIKKPERQIGNSKFLQMYFSENRLDREVHWAGFGFQIWLQILTHLSRASIDQTIFIDEPDVYLHPDIQKKLVRILRERYSQFIIATHSVEIINDADSLEIVSIHPDLKNAKRIRSEEEYSRLYQYIGSSQNAELARVAKARKVIFVEGKDRKILTAFARRFGYQSLYSGSVPFVELGGFGGWQKAKHAVWAFKEILDLDVSVFCLFDRDFRSDPETCAFETKFHEEGLNCIVLRRKEIENYLIDADALTRAIRKRASEKDVIAPERSTILEWLDQISQTMKARVSSQIKEKFDLFGKKDRDQSSFDQDIDTCMESFEAKWLTFEGRIALVPGKELISRFNEKLQDEGIGNVTLKMVLQEMKEEDLDPFFREALLSLDRFCE